MSVFGGSLVLANNPNGTVPHPESERSEAQNQEFGPSPAAQSVGLSLTGRGETRSTDRTKLRTVERTCTSRVTCREGLRGRSDIGIETTKTVPRVSVIIPAYNAAATIARTVDSAIGQTFRDFEIICVDDGSTDGTRAIVERDFGDRVRLVEQANSGPAAARNNGARHSVGRISGFSRR